MLFTDGGENITDYPKSLSELEAEAAEEKIHLMILGMGQARKYLPQYFKKENYRFTEPDGADIPERMMDLFEEAHRRRF